MKKFVFLVLVSFVFLLLLGSVALAGGYQTGGFGTTPHSGYASTSTKCKVCHAAHDAAAGGQVLLSSTVANACNYCHITTATSSKHPYGDTEANYTSDTAWNHSGVGYASIANTDAKASFVNQETSTCNDCHSVHGANAITIGTTTIAKKDPGVAGGPTATDENTFCANCHRSNHYSTSYNGAAPANYFGLSHIQGAANPSYGNTSATYTGRVAGTASTGCSNCHKVGDGTDRDVGTAPYIRNFPHRTQLDATTGALEFLDTTYFGTAWNAVTSTNKLDKVCLNCHYDGVTFGVGYTF